VTIEFPGPARKQAIASIKRYFDEVLDQEIGDLKAEMVLDFALKEIAPTVYNQAIQDAQKLVLERTGDMENALFATEFGYWERSARRK
jgi:uncharacterized protein (DUF2164 family)